MRRRLHQPAIALLLITLGSGAIAGATAEVGEKETTGAMSREDRPTNRWA